MYYVQTHDESSSTKGVGDVQLVLEWVPSDFCGALEHNSTGGSSSFLIFVNDTVDTFNTFALTQGTNNESIKCFAKIMEGTVGNYKVYSTILYCRRAHERFSCWNTK